MNCVLLICCAFDLNGLELDALDLLSCYMGERKSNQMLWMKWVCFCAFFSSIFEFSKILSIFKIYILFVCKRNKLFFDRFVSTFFWFDIKMMQRDAVTNQI